jgi:hypothetical protein
MANAFHNKILFRTTHLVLDDSTYSDWESGIFTIRAIENDRDGAPAAESPRRADAIRNASDWIANQK